MSQIVRVGLIGTSWWADSMFLPSLTSHPRTRVVGICGRNQERAGHMAAKYDIPDTFAAYEAMIRDASLDAIVISAPDDLHHPMTMRALAAGLHVLCEKPLALTVAQAREMYETAVDKGVVHMVLFTWRWMPHFQYVQQLVREGYVGRCYECEFRFMGGYARRSAYQWRFDASRANGVLADLGAHMIDLARMMVDEISHVQADLSVCVERPGPDGQPRQNANDSSLLTVQFANGAHGSIHTSAVAHVGDRDMMQTIALHGEKGSLRIHVNFDGADAGVVIEGCRYDQSRWERLVVPNDMWGDVDLLDFGRAMVPGIFQTQAAGARLFIDCILNHQPATPDFGDGLKAQHVIAAALESHKQGRRVNVASFIPR